MHSRRPFALFALTSSMSFFAAACEPAAPANSAGPPAASATASETATTPAAPAPIAVSEAARAIVGAADRSEEDRKLDAGRLPAEMLTFYGIAPGMKVAELMAGGGYTAELLARAVGPSGVVYGQNSKFLLDRFAEKPWTERLGKPVMKNVLRVEREIDDPLPPEAQSLDAVFLVLFYHDTVWMKADRGKMNASVFKALKPGGVFAIIDHSGRAGTGTSEAETLHRIEEKVVHDEVIAAGFRLAGEASFLRNPDDTRDWSASPRAAAEKRGTSDRFVLKFVKP